MIGADWESLEKEARVYYSCPTGHVIHGDSRKIIKYLPDEVFDVLHFDPPWQYRDKNPEVSVDEKYPTMPDEEIAEVFKECLRVVADNRHIWVWVTAPRFLEQGDLIRNAITETGMSVTYKNLYTWHKERFYGMGSYMRNECEFALLFVKGKRTGINRNIRNHCDAPAQGHSRKPLSAMCNFLRISSSPSTDLILDPFLNTGGMAYAAKLMKKRIIGIEIVEKFCRAAEQALSQGILFTEVADGVQD
jgi:DNA modification methylase